MAIKTEILHRLPNSANSVPFEIESIAIKNACFAVKPAKKGFSKDRHTRNCKFRTPQNPRQSIFVPKTAIKHCSIYTNIIKCCYIYCVDFRHRIFSADIVSVAILYEIGISDTLETSTQLSTSEIKSWGFWHWEPALPLNRGNVRLK
ncbi:hypothetical protein IQ270_28280 [Microcoleus sp. LEGE 07076]|uniref:hypothetical protein n=1 Tax=Microcoleus sp. LEGE 07076 TaxID=915322 RepID=UPI001881634C|nr:hypothetical protein [Microcoleus sp. LEGE 07076]MBE9188427.1 hypothetical protein [Microcoleus sp. LEGE 07076]